MVSLKEDSIHEELKSYTSARFHIELRSKTGQEEVTSMPTCWLHRITWS